MPDTRHAHIARAWDLARHLFPNLGRGGAVVGTVGGADLRAAAFRTAIYKIARSYLELGVFP